MRFDLPEKVKNYLKGRRILVTGASGYLAGNILGMLAETGSKTTCLSRQSKPARISPVVEWYRSEMTEGVWRKLITETDVVIHLAAQTSVRFAEEDPKADYAVNVKPILDLIEAAEKVGKNSLRIVFAATVTQCGIPEKLPVNESHPDAPITVYDQHKLEAETFFLEAARAGVFQAVSLRLPNVYGPGPAASARDRGILNQMVERARRSRPLTLISECENFLRDYLFVEDAARAFLYAACFMPEINGKYCVIGSGQGVSIREAFMTVQQCARDILNYKIEIQPTGTPLSAIDRRSFIADASFFRSRTGWTPQHPLIKGIERTFMEQM